MNETEKKDDVYSKESLKKGSAGFVETALRRFRIFTYLLFFFLLVFILLGAVALAFTPGVAITSFIYHKTLSLNPLLHYFSIGFSLALSYVLYGLSIIFIIPFINFINPIKSTIFRAPMFSIETIGWFIHNTLIYLVRYTFLFAITPTPLINLFYKMMGMKIGKGVMLNSFNIVDACHITIEDYVTIGGSATIFAHYGQKGYLVVAPVVIKKGAIIGLKASIMGDVVIGKKSIVPAHAVVLPKTDLKDGETYLG